METSKLIQNILANLYRENILKKLAIINDRILCNPY